MVLSTTLISAGEMSHLRVKVQISDISCGDFHFSESKRNYPGQNLDKLRAIS